MIKLSVKWYIVAQDTQAIKKLQDQRVKYKYALFVNIEPQSTISLFAHFSRINLSTVWFLNPNNV